MDPSLALLFGLESRPGDMAHTAVHLDGVVAGIHVVYGKERAGFGLYDPGIAEVPAPAVVAQNKFPPPRPAVVVADARPYAEGRQAVAIDAGDAPVRHAHQIARRPPIVDAGQKAPGAPAILEIGRAHV